MRLCQLTFFMAESDLVSSGKAKLYLNGTVFSDEMQSFVTGVTVEDEINLPVMFTIHFTIDDFIGGKWVGIDLDMFKLGDEVKIMMGIDQTEEMLAGEITALEPSFGVPATMEIRGYDRLHRLRFGTFKRSFRDVKDSDIASNIASELSLTPDVEETQTTHEYVFQNNQTNFEFLMERAKRLDYEMYVQDKTFIFRPSGEGAAAEVTLDYKIDFESFSAQLTTLTEGSEIEVRGWDVKNKEGISSTAGAGSENSAMGGEETGFQLSGTFGDSVVSFLHDPVVDAKEAEVIAKAKYNQALKRFMTGQGECPGNPKIRAGKTIELKGIGERFSGVYYVTASTHSLQEDQGYTTIFKVKRVGL